MWVSFIYLNNIWNEGIINCLQNNSYVQELNTSHRNGKTTIGPMLWCSASTTWSTRLNDSTAQPHSWGGNASSLHVKSTQECSSTAETVCNIWKMAEGLIVCRHSWEWNCIMIFVYDPWQPLASTHENQGIHVCSLKLMVSHHVQQMSHHLKNRISSTLQQNV